MFLASSMNNARASAGEPANKKSRSQHLSRQIDNLDCRLRQLEGDKTTFFQGCGGTQQEQSASQGPTTHSSQQESDLDGSTVELDSGTGLHAALQNSERGGGLDLKALRKPNLTDQASALRTILPFYRTPLQMEREVGICSFFSAKKDPSKLVLSFSLLPESPLTEIATLVCFALEAAGAERAPGAPPKGAVFK